MTMKTIYIARVIAHHASDRIVSETAHSTKKDARLAARLAVEAARLAAQDWPVLYGSGVATIKFLG